MTTTEGIYETLARIVGDRYVSDSFFEGVNNMIDPLPYDLDFQKESLPLAVVRPAAEDEVAEILAWANENRILVYPRGSGTSVTGGSRPREPGIVLNTNRMNRIEVYEEYGYFECGPGAAVEDVNRELEKRGFFLPVYPGSRLVASMGGCISNNTSGHIIDACIGKPRDYVLGIRAVLPTGEVLDTGTKGLRKAAGVDLSNLFVGGDGLFGVITSIRIRLVPSMKKAFGIACFEGPEAIARAVVRMYREKAPPPLFMEFMDMPSTTVGFEDAGLEVPPGPVIFFASMASSQDQAEWNMQQLLQVMGRENPISADHIRELDVWQKIWTAREVIISSLMRKHDGQFTGAEIVSALPNLVDCIQECARFSDKDPILEGVPLYLFGHIGALTFHPTYIVPNSWESEKRREFVRVEFVKEAEMNLKYGTCGGEWGQFAYRNAFFRQRYGDRAFQLVQGLKRVFDPNDILNRGVLA